MNIMITKYLCMMVMGWEYLLLALELFCTHVSDVCLVLGEEPHLQVIELFIYRYLFCFHTILVGIICNRSPCFPSVSLCFKL